MSIILSLVGCLFSAIGIIWLLVRLFQVKGALHGILGIFSCNLYTLIWGLINMGTHNLKKPLLSVLVGIVSSVAGSAMTGASALPQIQEAIQKAQQSIPAQATPAPANP